jgi:spore maturation protein B
MNKLISDIAASPILLLLCAAAVLLFRHQRSRQLYTQGVFSGLSSLKELVAPMLMLCIAVKLITACGICDKIAELLESAGIARYIPPDLLPLIITRPLSGAAANASLGELIQVCGVNSFEVFCAAVIMSSGDTCLYIYSTYFSVQTQKRSGGVLLLMLAVSLFSVIICILICNVRFFS